MEQLNPSTWFAQKDVPAVSIFVITHALIQVEWVFGFDDCHFELTTLCRLFLPGNPQDGFQQKLIYTTGAPLYYDSGLVQMGFPSNFGQVIVHTP